MKRNKITTIVIFLLAIGIGGYVVYDNQSQNNRTEEQIQEYLDSDGADTVTGNRGPQVGMQAIDFDLPLYSIEETMSLSQHQGDYVIVNFWASWCKPCTDEIPHFIQFYEEFEDHNVEILGVNMTTTETNRDGISQFLNDFDINYPVLMDEDGEVYEDYQVYGLPMTYFIDPDGNIVNLIRGYISYDRLVSFYEDLVEEYENG